MGRPRKRRPAIGTIVQQSPATALLQQALGHDSPLVAEALVHRLAAWLHDRGGPRFFIAEDVAAALGIPAWDSGSARNLLLSSGWIKAQPMRYGGICFEMASWGQLFPGDAVRERDKKRKRAKRATEAIPALRLQAMPPPLMMAD